MALDSVRPLAMECPAEGGTQTVQTPTEINTLQDALAAAGLFVDGPTVSAADKTVLLDRTTGGTMRFTDQNVTRVLPEIVSTTVGQTTAHSVLRDMAHFMADQGPDVGFGNTTCALSYSGMLLTSVVWYTSAAMTTKIYSRTLSYATGALSPSTVTHVIYNAAGTALRTATDTFTYTGTLCTSISRAWS